MYHSHFWTAAFADLNYGKAAEAEQPTERVLIGDDDAAADDDDVQKPAAKPAQYYTYTPAETSEESCDE
jgi:hypothetical protein